MVYLGPGPFNDDDPVATQPVPPAEDTAVDAETAAAVAKIPACTHCGGRHLRACPRVRSMSFHPSGALAGVVFWPDGKWNEQHVLFPEELIAPDKSSGG